MIMLAPVWLGAITPGGPLPAVVWALTTVGATGLAL